MLLTDPPRRAARLSAFAVAALLLSTAPTWAQAPVRLEGTEIVAVVGDQVILAGDLLGQINQLLESHADQMTAQQLAEQRRIGIEQLLPRAIDTKLGYLEFLRTVDSEVLPQIRADMYRQFDEKRLPEIIEEASVASAAELDAKLRRYGSSLNKQRRAFFEQSVHREIVRRHINLDVEVSHEDMLGYYQQHANEFDYAARVRWEHLVIYFRNHADKATAHQAMAALGNEVLRGAPLDAVARRGSEGPSASQGGQFDWTEKESLASETLDHALFTLPVNQLSQIIEDENSFHIIRVIERREEGHTSFVEAQVEIEEQIRSGRRREDIEAYLAQLRANTPVWTIFDDEIARQGENNVPGR